MTDQNAGEGSEKGPEATPSEGEKGGEQDPGGQNPFRDREIEDVDLKPGLSVFFGYLFPFGQRRRRREERRLSEQRRLNEEIRLQEEEAAANTNPERFDAPESVIPQSTVFAVDPWGGPGPDAADSEAVPEPTPTGSDDHDLPGLDDDHEGEVVGGGRTTMSLGGVIGATLAGLALIALVVWLLGRGGSPPAADSALEPTTGSGTAQESARGSTASADGPEVGTTETWSVVDVVGNWRPFDEFDEIIPDREADGLLAADALAATDVIGVDVESDGSSATIGIDHAGDAQSIQAHPRATYRAGVIWVMPDGRTVEVLYHDDGTVKISDALSEWTIEAFWEHPDRLLIVIDGVGVFPGSLVAATVFLELFDGVNLQSVEVPTADG